MTENQTLWKILQEVTDSIKFAEAKAIAIISTSGILTAFLFSKENINKNFENNFVLSIFILCILFLFCSIFFSLLCLKPSFKYESKKSVLYFNSILSNYNNHEELNSELYRVCADNKIIRMQIAEQIYTKSQIAKGKFKYTNLSIFSFIAFLTIILVLVIIK